MIKIGDSVLHHSGKLGLVIRVDGGFGFRGRPSIESL